MGGKQYSGNGYWAGQLGSTGVLGVAFVIGGPVGMVSDTEEPGRWLIVFLIGVAFLLTFAWLLRSFRSSSKKQRAVYAWALMQQNGALSRDGVNPTNDMHAMAVARRARDGQLSAAELRQLQALRPDSLYPGDPPRTGPTAPTFTDPNI